MKKNLLLLFIAVMFSTVLLAQPANDNICDALALTLDADCSTTLPYTNVAATVQVGEDAGTCYGEGTIEQTVWFSFVAPSTGAISITTDFSNSGMQDNQITVFEYDAAQAFDCATFANYLEVACNEDKIPAPVNTEFNAAIPPIAVTSGQTYYIQVDGFNAGDEMTPDISEGTFCIVVSTITSPANDNCESSQGYGGFGPACTKIWGDVETEFTSTIGATAGNDLDVFSCDGSDFNASVYYTFLSGVTEVEFNLLEGENINVTLLSTSETCDDADNGSVELTGNCFTDIDASATTDPADADVLFTNLEVGGSYLMAIWTNEGEATDFQFCLTRAPAYECGDNVCYDLIESYNNCESDCPCISSMDFVSLADGAISTEPTGVCAEIIGGTSDPANSGIYIPFLITTLDSDLTGSLVSATQGSIFTSSSNLNFFGYATNPLIPLPNNEYDGNLNYLFLTQSQISAGGSVTISFTSDNGACSASIELNLADLVGPSSNECGNCNLSVEPDYSSLQCPDFNTNLDIVGAVGNLWLSQNSSTIFDAGDIAIPYSGGYPTGDFTLTIYDSGQPNCAFPLTLTFGDYFCPETTGDPIGTFCRLDPSIDENGTAICDNATGNVLVPISFGNNVTGVLTSNPDIISGDGPQGPYYASIDPNNCSAVEVSVMDDSQVDAFSGTPIFNINSPASLAGGNANVGTSGTTWGVDITTLGVCPSSTTGSIVLVNDESSASTEFCSPDGGAPEPSQCTGIAGNIALIDRGNCTFVNKASNAQQCGAIAFIICNNDTANPDDVIPMGGATTPVVTIPGILLSYNDCLAIKAELGNGVEACIGAPQTVAGCERTFTIDVCNDYNTQTCDDSDCSTENDVATVGPDGAEVCACAGTPIVCPEGQSFNNETCACETGAIAGCTDPCDPNFDAAANESDPAACAGYDTTCDDGDCNTTDSYDNTTCACVNTATTPPTCDDGICSNGVETYNAATCMCENGTPITPPTCDDGDCSNGVETYNTETCMCEDGMPGEIPTCDDMNCNTADTYDAANCMCINTPITPPNCDDMDCSTNDTYDNATCTCIYTPITCATGEVFNIDLCMCVADDFCNGVEDECGVCDGPGIVAGTCDCAGSLPPTWYADNDNDGFGDPNNSTSSCEQPTGFVANSSDDDDTMANQADVPTLSQWGLILLGLILLSISTVAAIQKKYSLVYEKGVANSSTFISYFNKHLFKQMLIKSIPILLFIFMAISLIEGGWFLHNFIGTFLSGVIFVYILHFIELSKQFDQDV